MPEPLILWSETDRFLKLLGRSGDVCALLFPPKDDKKSNARPLVLDEEGRRTAEAVLAMPRYGRFSLGIRINPGGTKANEITEGRALFFEADGALSNEEQQDIPKRLGWPSPSVAVRSGSRSLHQYWVAAPGKELSPLQWREAQERLIAAIQQAVPDAGVDACIKDPSRVMRAPGGIHPDTGQRCRIHSEGGETFDLAALVAMLPELPKEKGPPAPPALATGDDVLKAKRALALLPPKNFTSYPDWMQVGMALHSVSPDLLPDWIQWSQGMGEAFDEEECRTKWSTFSAERDGGVGIGTLVHLAKPYGFAPSRQAAPLQTKPAPLTFDERWACLEEHAAEMACSTWPVMKTIASLASRASDLEIHRLGQRQLEQLLEQAQRRVRAKAEPVKPGGTFTIKPTPWAVEGIFRHGLNLLSGQPGAGKSRLAAACMAAWLRGDATWLQRRLNGDDPRHRYALIIGTDQNLEDWHLTLGPVGLTTKISDTEVRIHERLTIYSLETGIQLDADGQNTIRRWVDEHPGGMVLVDSLSQCLPPGVDEDKSSAARPVHQLQEVLGDAWAILTHHSRKGAGKEGNLGVGAGRGSGAIDAAVSRVVGLGLIHRMENGQMVAQESDPRRELLSTKRGGKTEHLIVSSDANGFWEVHGTAEALKHKERQERILSNLTEAQSEVLSAIEAADCWMTTREVAEALGDEYEATGAKAANLRKVLKRLEALGQIRSERTGLERSWRVALSQWSSREDEMTGSNGSIAAARGISLAQPPAQSGSKDISEPSEPSEPMRTLSEPLPEPARSPARSALSLLSYPSSGSDFAPFDSVEAFTNGGWGNGWTVSESSEGFVTMFNASGHSLRLSEHLVRPCEAAKLVARSGAKFDDPFGAEPLDCSHDRGLEDKPTSTPCTTTPDRVRPPSPRPRPGLFCDRPDQR
jgi:hypothetical protein